MESLKTHFFSPLPQANQTSFPPFRSKPTPKNTRKNSRFIRIIKSQEFSDPWTLSDGNDRRKFKPSRPRKKPLSDDDARRIIKAKARYLSELRRNQGCQAQTPRWIRRTPEQMIKYIEDDRDGHLYGKHVVAAIQQVRGLAGLPEGSYDMREVMGSFVAKLTFREMCTVLKEQRGWRQARDFFAWMKLQLCYRPTVVIYTIMLRLYGQVGKIRLAEQTFLEMLDAGCEPDDVACGTMLCAYARWGRHKDMLVFYTAVRRRNVVPSISVYNFMISSLQKKKQHEKVIQLWEHMMEAGAVPNEFTYTVIISSYAKQNLLKNALETLEKMRKSKFIPDEATYCLLINSCVRIGDQAEALRLYWDMKAWGIVPSNYTCAALLTLHYRNSDYSKALSLFLEIEKSKIVIDEVIYGIIIRIYGKLGLYDEAEQAFQEAEKVGLLKDEKTYAAIAQVYLASGNHRKALSVFELMDSKNVQKSAFSYSSLLRCFIAKEDVESAESTFKKLTDCGQPDAVSCNELLILYIRLGLLDNARDFVAYIEKLNVQFDEDLYRTVLQVHCKDKNLEKAEGVLEEMEGKGYSLDKYAKTSLMSMYGESGAVKKAETLFSSLGQQDIVARGVMLSLYLENGDIKSSKQVLKSLVETSEGLSLASQLLSKFSREGNVEKAFLFYGLFVDLGSSPTERALSSLIEISGKKLKIRELEDLVSSISGSTQKVKLVYCAIIVAMINCGKLAEAMVICEEVLSEGLSVDAVTLSVLVNALSKSGNHRDAKMIIKKSFQCGCTLDDIAYNTYINAMLESGKLHFASEIFGRMISKGVCPTIRTYNTMISVYGRGGKLEKAIEMFNTAKRMGFQVDEKTYTNMICYYGKSGKSQEASLLFMEMQKEGIIPGKISYNMMINAYATNGEYQEAENLFQSLKKDGLIPDSLSYLALIQAYVKGQKFAEAEQKIENMQIAGISLSCSHFNSLISAFIKNGRIGDAERVFFNMKQAGLAPDVACCRAMTRAYVDFGLVEEGIFFFEQIKESVKPDALILTAAVHFYARIGEYSKAEELVFLMNQENLPFLSQLKIGSRERKLSE
ncbi:tetratricopeptide repeat (TPR)-like superfamily protein isoform X1 [Wolffia australiana]